MYQREKFQKHAKESCWGHFQQVPRGVLEATFDKYISSNHCEFQKETVSQHNTKWQLLKLLCNLNELNGNQ
jgi:hypothetical protein